MWPRMAKMLGMEVAGPVPFSLVTYMADKRPVWDAIVKKEKLQPIPYEQTGRCSRVDSPRSVQPDPRRSSQSDDRHVSIHVIPGFFVVLAVVLHALAVRVIASTNNHGCP